jgi:hypothetical protein
MTIPEQLLTPIDRARTVLGDVGRTKVYELVNAGEIVKVCIGRRSFIVTESLAAYVDRLSEAASARADDPSAQPLRQ